jgi:hypothetical protein
MVTPTLAVFQLALSRSAEVAKQILAEAFAGVVVTDRYGAYSRLPLHSFMRRSDPSCGLLPVRCGSSAPWAGQLGVSGAAL